MADCSYCGGSGNIGQCFTSCCYKCDGSGQEQGKPSRNNDSIEVGHCVEFDRMAQRDKDQVISSILSYPYGSQHGKLKQVDQKDGLTSGVYEYCLEAYDFEFIHRKGMKKWEKR